MSSEHDESDRAPHRGAVEAAGRAEASLPPKLFRVAVEHAYDAIVITTPDLDRPGPKILYVNQAFSKMTGYEAQEVLGKTPRILQGPRTSRRVLDRLRRELERGEPFRGRAVNYRKDGTEFWLEWRIAPVRDEAGRITQFVALQRDVTESMRIRARHAQIHAELERLVDARTSDLTALVAENERLLARERSARHRAETAHRQLEREARAKDEFLAMLAHELRNPLASIATATQLLELGHSVSPGARRACGVLERQTAHLVRLVDDLLDTARLSTGRIQLRKSEVALQDVVEEALEANRALIEARRHTLVVQLHDEHIVLHGDPTRLVQALGNLLTNAARYTPEGGRILVETNREDGTVAIRVRDTGIGIPPRELDDVFGMFRQGQRTLARTEGGLGLGLALTRRLVELHGGSVEARSEGPGTGSEFTIRLPVYRTGGRPIPTAAKQTPRRGPKRLRILVVEDNQDAREALAMLLSARGHIVETAEDGLHALRRLRKFSPQVVLLDIGLPGMDGYEVADRIRRANGRDVRLVAITGYGRNSDVERSRDAGFDAHLVKPVSPERLEEELARAPRA